MSFSVSYVGKPEAVKRKLLEYSGQLSGHSKDEFDAILPALETLLAQHVGYDHAIQLDAMGHATFEHKPGGQKTHGTCSVSLKTLGVIAE